MPEQATAMIAGIGDAWQALTALAVTYAFSVVGAVILLVAGFLIARFAERAAYAALKRVRGIDETLARFFSRLVRYAILALVLVTVLGQFGVQTASIIAAIGAAGLAIGLALQGTLQNIAAGIMLLVLKPFRAGESITAGNVSGTVREIGLFATELSTGDGVYMLVPNSELWKSPVTNFSRNKTRRNDIVVGIGYDDDMELATSTLLRLAREDRGVSAQPPAEAFVSELADSAVMVTLRYWAATGEWWQTRLRLTRAVKLAFDDAGLSIPFPQQDVHLTAESTSVRQAAE